MKFDMVVEVENTEYGLAAVDYAFGGKTFYRLYRSNDSGKNWLLVNEDPFGGVIRQPYQICFFTKELGFVIVPLSDGDGSFFSNRGW